MILPQINDIHVKKNIPEDKRLPPTPAASGKEIFKLCTLGNGGRSPAVCVTPVCK